MEVLTLLLLFIIAPLHLSIRQPSAGLEVLDMHEWLTNRKEESKDANRDALQEERESMLVAGIIQNKSNSVPRGTPTPQSFSNPEAPSIFSNVTPEDPKSITPMEDVLTKVLPRHYSNPDAEAQPVRNAAGTRTTSAIIERREYDQTVTEPSVKSEKNARIGNRKRNGRGKNVKEMKTKKTEHFPYFKDNYCPPDCACYGGVVQCSDKSADKIPYGIPYSSRYILLMNNHINSIQLDLLRGYASLEFLVLSKNRLTDDSVEGAFEGVPALKRLYLDGNLLASVPTDLPASLEELRLDNNRVRVMSESYWARCRGLLVLSLSNNSLGEGSGSLPDAVLSPLQHLRTLNLDHNQLTSVPLGLPLSVKELYLRGNLIEHFGGKAFNGQSRLAILDLSANRLSNKGLPKDALIQASHLESLNLEGNRLQKVPRHLPSSIKTLNLEGNLISAIGRVAFNSLKNLEHLGLAWNKISKVAPGAFLSLRTLHQLDLCHNALSQVPRQLPQGLRSLALTHNKIQSVPRDAFCWGQAGSSLSGLVRVQLADNLMDMGKLDSKAFRCLRGFQVVHFY
ncbi:decorin [Hippocampus comes]|uniref:decorin n=1 Tax=Hippocampus comes TaxID=109280 RepID=UPI00094F0736|nr:PREDICTED: decorin-like [Hippocampus comes]